MSLESDHDFWIESLASSAELFLGLDPRIAEKTATRYVNDGLMPFNDHVANHGVYDRYVYDMVLHYHVMAPKQIEERIK